MKCFTFLFLVAIGLSLMGCSEIERRRKRSKTPEIQSFIFKTNYFLSGQDLHLSFPNWFNDSIVQEKKVRSIVHRTYVKGSEDIDELKESKHFFFNEAGQLTSMQRKRYYENFVVENVLFNYSSDRDLAGYVAVEIIDSLHPNEETEYDYYVKESYHPEYLVYTNSNTGDYLFCVLDSKLCGIVAVDSLFHPTPQDVIVYGVPSRRKKQFKIENLVKETQTVDYTYFKNSRELQRIKRDNYPFYITKDVLLSKNGKCIGFVDSTFSGEKYLNKSLRKFHFNKGLPSRMSHQGMRSGTYETFEYTFYE